MMSQNQKAYWCFICAKARVCNVQMFLFGTTGMKLNRQSIKNKFGIHLILKIYSINFSFIFIFRITHTRKSLLY